MANLATDRDGREAGDLVLREFQGDGICLDPRHGPDRDRDLAAPEQVTSLEHDVRDRVLSIDEEPIDAAEAVVVGGHDVARAADLDPALRNAVEDNRHVRVVVGWRPAVTREVIVRLREDGLDPDVPIGILERELAEAQVREVLDGGQPSHLLGGGPQRDSTRGVIAARKLDGHEPGEAVSVRRLDDEVRDPAPGRIDDDIGEPAKGAVGAVDRGAKLEARCQLPSRTSASVSCGIPAAA
jgi:hypothetical protein